MPLPIAYFFQILAVLRNILLVLYQLVVHLLDQMSALVAKLRQMDHSVFYKVEAVDLVLDTHIEGSRNGSFFHIAVYRHIVVVPLVGQLMDQSRIAVEREDDWFILGKDRVILRIAESVRMFVVGLHLEEVNHIYNTDLQLSLIHI